MITIAFDKECIGTILRIDTPDGKRVVRGDERYLDLEFLKPFIGNPLKLITVDKRDPNIEVEEFTSKIPNYDVPQILKEVKLDDLLTKEAGKPIFYLYCDKE